MGLFLYFAGSIVAVKVLSWFLFTTPVPSVAGVYKQKGKWYYVKYAFFYLMLLFRKRQRPADVSSNAAGFGIKSKANKEDMDKPQVLPEEAEHPLAVDAVYFSGGNDEGIYVVAGTARRQLEYTETLLYLRLPKIGLLEMPSIPFTKLKSADPNGFSADGLQMQPVDPLKKWNLKFDGKMRSETGELHHVTFDLDWTSSTLIFDFDIDMSLPAMCESCAREDWTMEYFNTLKMAHQTHYEQFGRLQGEVCVSGRPMISITLHALRDHSYGNVRNWRDLHRYCLQYCWLDNGMAVAVGLICFPKTFSRLVMGYVVQPGGKQLDPVSAVGFEFVDHGDNGNPPHEFEFNFTAGETEYHVTCSVLCSPVFYIGNNEDARIHERMCIYTVNGVKGYGISEWEYRNISRHALEEKEAIVS